MQFHKRKYNEIIILLLRVLSRAGPKELLREQKRKSARFLLAPIAASRETLVKAQNLLVLGNCDLRNAASENASAADAEEVCTFSLILKNAASLLDDKDPLKVEADTSLAELIQSFSDLGTVVENSNFELSDDR
ncbi:hypothetical protein TRIUR3_00981 [Triticum urartu]|uniref:Uncharacterized protein n=1 Tax=Triticum urartu TaxID=4572 RepID=M7Z4D6_TRIUA|nr:hypothetical protein TRIUR3_00981 [Triticum urartu]